MTDQPEQLVLDPEILAPLAERVCIRFCKSIDVDLEDRRVCAPVVMVGPRLSLADAAPEVAGRLVVKLARGHRVGFIVLHDDEGRPGTFGWFVLDAAAAPLVKVLDLAVIPLVSAADDDEPEPFTSTGAN